MSDPQIVNAILELAVSSPKRTNTKTKISSPSEVNVLYIGTATYDLSTFRKRQVQCFVENGCAITSLEVALKEDNEAIKKIEEADVIVVAGGNTLFAIDRWEKFGLVPFLRKVMERGTIISGGSAGAMLV